MRTAAGSSLLSLLTMTLVGAQARAQPAEPPLDEPGDLHPPMAREPRPGQPIEGSLDYDVSYDDVVAQSYDDGYDPEAYAQFQDTLSPYGEWIDDNIYGRVWQPSVEAVGADFSPYATDGQWALTEYGWTWVSDWDWGWAPFHYGRWLAVADRGWCWMPGTLWGPAWVTWRSGGGYVGWAPLPPHQMGIGSPLGARSPWRFARAAELGRARTTLLSSQSVPRIFGGMNVVSNPRALPIGGAQVRVNAGPVLAGARALAAQGGPARLAAIAPRALPQRAIEAHAGTPIAQRPWVRAGGGAPFPDRAYVQRAGGSDPRRGIAPQPTLPRGPAQPRGGFPAGSAINRRGPGVRASSMTSARGYPGPRGSVYRAAPAIAPRPWGGAPVRSAAPTLSRPSFGGGASSGGGRSFAGGGGRRR
jgi:hypothetical protein